MRFRAPRKWILGVVCGWGLSSVACSRGSDTVSSGATPPPEPSSEASAKLEPMRAVRVGTQVGGLADQPNYDAEAEALRRSVEGRLPDPLPSSTDACKAMLDAVRMRYVAREGERSEVVANLDQTRTDELEACRLHTGPAAASCVAVALDDARLEYPKALDQCMRIYPR